MPRLNSISGLGFYNQSCLLIILHTRKSGMLSVINTLFKNIFTTLISLSFVLSTACSNTATNDDLSTKYTADLLPSILSGIDSSIAGHFKIDGKLVPLTINSNIVSFELSDIKGGEYEVQIVFYTEVDGQEIILASHQQTANYEPGNTSFDDLIPAFNPDEAFNFDHDKDNDGFSNYQEVTQSWGNPNTTHWDISFTINGLSSDETITLSLNERSAEIFSTNGTFSSGVLNEDAYSVAIISIPEGKTCEANNAAGTALSAIDDIAIDCSEISPPQNITPAILFETSLSNLVLPYQGSTSFSAFIVNANNTEQRLTEEYTLSIASEWAKEGKSSITETVTSKDGIALIDYSAVSCSGEDTITATLNETISASAVLEIQTLTLGANKNSNETPNDSFTVGSLTTGSESSELTWGEATNISAYIVDMSTHSPYTYKDLEVQFTSECVESGKAEMETNVISDQGYIEANYTNISCRGTDTITATLFDDVVASLEINTYALLLGTGFGESFVEGELELTLGSNSEELER